MQQLDDKQWKTLKQKLMRSKQIPDMKMGEPEKEYVSSRGRDILELHATDFVRKRLAPAEPKNDGFQTPSKGHPVFIAQHATGTSDRTKLAKFHNIRAGAAMTEKQITYVVGIILRWIEDQVGSFT